MDTDFSNRTFKYELRHRRLKLSQLLQFLYAAVNVGALDFGGARQAETFAAEGRRDTAVNHRPPDIVVNRAARRGEITHHAAHKGIAGAGRVHHLLTADTPGR